MSVVMKPGKFYKDRNGFYWCCFKIVADQASCVRVVDSRIESFYLDGRYDISGKREHTLVKAVAAPRTFDPKTVMRV